MAGNRVTGSSSPRDGAAAAGAGCEPPLPPGNAEGREQQCTGVGQLRSRAFPDPASNG